MRKRFINGVYAHAIKKQTGACDPEGVVACHVVAWPAMNSAGFTFPNGCSAAAHRSEGLRDPNGVPQSWKCVVPKGAGTSLVKHSTAPRPIPPFTALTGRLTHASPG